MAVDASLRVAISADVQDAVKGIEKVEFSLNDCKKALNELKAIRGGVIDNNELLETNKRVSVLTDTIKKLERAGTDGFDNFGQAIKKTEAPISAAYSNIRKLANILPGLGISSLILIGFEVLGNALSELAPKIFGVDAAQSLLNKTMAEATGKVAGEVTEIQALVSIATDEKNSRDLRTKAFKDLQDQYPNAFKNMSLEKTSLEDLKKATDHLTDALIRQAQIKGLESVISKVSGEINELLASSTEEVIKSAGVFGVIKSLFSGNPASILTDQLNSNSEKLVKLKTQLNEVLKTSLDLGDKDILSTKQDKPVKIKVVPEFEPQKNPIKFGTLLDLSNADLEIKTIQKKLDGKKLNIDFTFKRDEILERTKQLGDDISVVLSAAVNSAIVDVSESLGEALASGDFSQVGSKLVAEIGSVVEELGKALIAFAAVKIAIDLAGKSLNPYVALAAGVAAVIAGAALKSVAGKQHKFAEGGIVTGPTNALIGEAGPEVIFPLDKLNRFVKQNTGAGNMNVNVAGKISGNDLQLVLARNAKNQSFV